MKVNFVNRGKDTAFDFKLDDGADFKAYLSWKDSKRLFVLFNGAVDLSKQYPSYQRWSWKEKFPGNVLYILDPMINRFKSDDLNLAWYIGNNSILYQDIINDFVSHVADLLGVEEVYAYGSSGGGFASLMLAKKNPDIYAIAINPQTDIFYYHKKELDRYLNLAWGGGFHKKNDMIINEMNVLNFAKSNALIVQNLKDVFHFENHFLRFLRMNDIAFQGGELLGKSGISFMVYDHPSGHGAEPLELFPKIIQSAIDNRKISMVKEV